VGISGVFGVYKSSITKTKAYRKFQLKSDKVTACISIDYGKKY